MARIRRSVRLAIGAALLAALAACSFVIRLDAVFIDGRLGFVVPADAHEPRGCLFHLSVSDAAGASVWELAGDIPRPDDCPAWLPLLYGRAPPSTRTVVPARPLRAGAIYVLRASQGDTVEAAFRLRRDGDRLHVENLDLADPAVRAADEAGSRWRADRDRAADVREQAWRNATEGPYEDRPLPAEQR